MPSVSEIEVPVPPALGVAVEGSAAPWPGPFGMPALPQFDSLNRQRHYIEIFDRGQTSYAFTAKSSAPWISLSATHGTINEDQRLWADVDWAKTPKGTSDGFVTISGAEREVTVKVETFNPETPTRASLQGFTEGRAMLHGSGALHEETSADPVHWEKISDYGRTLSSMAIFPVTAKSVIPPQNSSCLEYRMYLSHSGTIEVETILAPTLNFVPGRSLRYAVSFDDQTPMWMLWRATPQRTGKRR